MVGRLAAPETWLAAVSDRGVLALEPGLRALRDRLLAADEGVDRSDRRLRPRRVRSGGSAMSASIVRLEIGQRALDRVEQVVGLCLVRDRPARGEDPQRLQHAGPAVGERERVGRQAADLEFLLRRRRHGSRGRDARRSPN